METTDFTTQDGRGQLQKLRRLLVRAVSESKEDTDKNLYLTTLLNAAATAATTNIDGESFVATTDQYSRITTPLLITTIKTALSESTIYAGDYRTQLIADLNDAVTELAA